MVYTNKNEHSERQIARLSQQRKPEKSYSVTARWIGSTPGNGAKEAGARNAFLDTTCF